MDATIIAALVAAVVALFTGLVTALVTLWVARQRGVIDQDLQARLKIAEARFPAYTAIWQCMAPLSMRAATPLTEDARSDLRHAFRTAFYDKGAGLVLSHAALRDYLAAMDVLDRQQSSDSEIRSAFSTLRTQMKTDLAIYTDDEARTPVRDTRT
jgi:hypothetical protein